MSDEPTNAGAAPAAPAPTPPAREHGQAGAPPPAAAPVGPRRPDGETGPGGQPGPGPLPAPGGQPQPGAQAGGEAAAAAAGASAGNGTPETAPPDAVEVSDLAARAAERDEYLALAQRTRADFENYRKRVARDAAAAEARAVSRLVRELLPAIDNLERALAAAAAEQPDDHPGHLVDGMRLVRDDLIGALARAGVESYDPRGERFDPELHEAIAQHDVAGATPGTVVEVYQAGYRLNGTLLRPARVVVAGSPAGAGATGQPAGEQAEERGA